MSCSVDLIIDDNGLIYRCQWRFSFSAGLLLTRSVFNKLLTYGGVLQEIPFTTRPNLLCLYLDRSGQNPKKSLYIFTAQYHLPTYIFFKFKHFFDNYTCHLLSFFVVLTSKIVEQTLFMGINIKIYATNVKPSGQQY